MGRSIPNRGLMLALGVALTALAAYADIPPPGTDECRGKQAGDACRLGGTPGVCADKTCGRLDYSRGVPPKSVSVPCLRCDTEGDRSLTTGAQAR